MTRTVFLLLMVALSPAFALASPVPKETEADKLKRLFGATVDPEKNSKFMLDGEKLVVRVTDAPHLMQQGDQSAPRVTRTVEGDFTAQVQIRLPAPRKDEPLPRRGELVQVGLFLSDEGSLLATHARTLNVTPTGKDTFRRQGRFYVWQQNGSSSYGSGGGAFDPETVHFRLRRADGKLFAAASADGKSWHEFGGNQTPFPDKSTLGLYLANPSGIPYGVEFENFTITPKVKK
jgi:hypothetical protein